MKARIGRRILPYVPDLAFAAAVFATTVFAATVLTTTALTTTVWGAPEVDQKEVCLACHDLGDQLAAAQAHPPARDGDCTACHNPHVSRFAGLLKERPGPLCLSCHGALTAELDQEHVHGPVGEGRCAECHEPHGGEHEKLLKGSGTQLCISCHPEVADWMGEAVRHNPFRREVCHVCHLPHASSYPALGKRPIRDACLLCHRNREKLLPAHQGYPVERTDCITCHDAHAGPRKGLFPAQLHPSFEERECDSCHGDPASAEPFALQQPQSALCGDCHDAEVEAVRSSPFAHVTTGGGECTTCHDAHAGSEHQLKGSVTEVCLSCHDPGGSSSGFAGRYTSHGEAECSTCHAPHGGDRPRLLREEPIELCSGCHEHQHSVTHPMGETARDPRNGRPMDCLSCHGMHDAPYEKYMHQDGSRDLCLTCHTDLARRQ